MNKITGGYISQLCWMIELLILTLDSEIIGLEFSFPRNCDGMFTAIITAQANNLSFSRSDSERNELMSTNSRIFNKSAYLLCGLSILCLSACGKSGDDLDGDQGKAEIADKDQYGAYHHGNSQGRYVDAVLSDLDYGNWRTYQATPEKPKSIGDTGYLNFWIVDDEPVEISGKFYLKIDMEGCAYEDFDAAIMHFGGLRGTPDYVQYSANLSLYQEGEPDWYTKGVDMLDGHKDARGPWKLFIARKKGSTTDCSLASVAVEFRMEPSEQEKKQQNCLETGGEWLDLVGSGAFSCSCHGEAWPDGQGNCAFLGGQCDADNACAEGQYCVDGTCFNGPGGSFADLCINSGGEWTDDSSDSYYCICLDGSEPEDYLCDGEMARP